MSRLFTEHFYSNLRFADGTLNPPQATAAIKSQPSDFEVDEIMSVESSGEGEHIWLQVSKVKTHSDQVAKSLAMLANIHPKDIGISGMKDFLAHTTQWFSVWLPGVKDEALPNWCDLDTDNVKVLQVQRHSRKLRRGTHSGNRFKILLRHIEGDRDFLEQRLALFKVQGVPSYFGEQRFGRGGSNLQQVEAMFVSGRKIKQRQKRSMLLSSARSWLFNCVLSERLNAGIWLTPQVGEPLNLDGSRQFFIADDLTDAQKRVEELDIHTTAPLWGQGVDEIMKKAHDLSTFEAGVVEQIDVLKAGLEKAKLDYARRAMRFVPESLDWTFLEHDEHTEFPESRYHLELNFTLGRGQFATSLLRELVQARL